MPRTRIFVIVWFTLLLAVDATAIAVLFAAAWLFATVIAVTSPAVPHSGVPVDVDELDAETRSILDGVPLYTSDLHPIAADSFRGGIVIGSELLASEHGAVVVAHEAGHHRGRHWVLGALWMLTTPVLAAGAVAAILLGSAPSVTAAVFAAASLVAVAGEIASSRACEFAADAYAAARVGAARVAATLEAVVAAERTPLISTHPPLHQRLHALRPPVTVT
jgi:hypothetical protein